MVQSDEKLDEVYYEIALNEVSNRNYIVPRSQVSKFIKPNKVVYRSIYGYKNTIMDHFKIYKTVSSFKDTCYIETLVFDIDCHEKDLLKGLTEGVFRVKELLKQLSELTGTSVYSIPIWFSGRGFHLQTPDFFHFKPSEYLRDEVIATMKHYFPFIDHKPYMKTGLIRMNYSLNSNTNTYKIPISFEELDSVTDIIKKAQSQCDSEGNFWKVNCEDWDSYDLSDKIIKSENKESEVSHRYENTRVITCLQKMYNEGPIKGQRHDNLLRMIAGWRSIGFNHQQCVVMAKSYIKGEWTDYEVINQVNSVWKGRYVFSCKDEVMAKYCDVNCRYYRGKNFQYEYQDNLTIEQLLKQELKMIDDPENPTFDLNHIFELGVEAQFRPGNMVVLFGHPKIGKSFFMQYITQYSKKKTLYYTLEMPSTEIYHRQLQIALKEDEQSITERLHEDEELHRHVDHITFFDTSPTLEDIQSHIDQFTPDWVIIDTVDMVSEDQFKQNETAKLTYLFQRFKQMAIANKIVILIVQHISASEARDKDGNLKPLHMFSGLFSKESSRKADMVIGWEGYHDSNKRMLRSLARRRGHKFEKQIEYSPECSMLYTIKE